ncbi:MAG: DUF5678 domain-containing protein [Candidatus Micrarchaeota archaeon]|nr:DUF5678 domain-containing protein [Candidatus Micrarchaeota archaeon]
MYARFENHEWIVKHSAELEKYAGKWIAVANQKLVGVADTLKDLMKKPEVKTSKEPLVTQIPTAEDALYILVNKLV